MDENKIIEYINNEIENEFLDFKLKLYDWSETNGKSDFISDVICLANSNAKEDRYIITGVKVKPNGERIIEGIEPSDAKDSAVYQELITENVEPSLSIDFKIIEYDGKHFGIFRIYGCEDRPYLAKKKYGNLESGYIKVRRGSRNTNISRYILDSIYNAKQPKLISKFKINGIEKGEPCENIALCKFDFFPDLEKEKDELISLFDIINNFKVDDIVNSNSKTGNIVEKFNTRLFGEQKIEIKEEIIKNIKGFAKIMDIKLNDEFFDIGNAGKYFVGISMPSYLYESSVNYEETGSKKSLKKYHLILELNQKINRLIGWVEFLDKIKNFYYLQLAITETGTIDDEEVNVSIEIPKGIYVDYDSFPQINEEIDEEFGNKYARMTFMPKYNNSISDFRMQPLSSSPNLQSTFNYPLMNSGLQNVDSYYDFIDYNVLEKEDFIIIDFTIKNLKIGETMVFPGNIILNDKISSVKYSIISKKNKNKIVGTIEIK